MVRTGYRVEIVRSGVASCFRVALDFDWPYRVVDRGGCVCRASEVGDGASRLKSALTGDRQTGCSPTRICFVSR